MQKRPSKHRIETVRQRGLMLSKKHVVTVTATTKPKVTQSETRVVIQIPVRKYKKNNGGKEMPKPRPKPKPWSPLKKRITRITSSGGKVPFKIKPTQLDIDRQPGVNVRVKKYPKKDRHIRI